MLLSYSFCCFSSHYNSIVLLIFLSLSNSYLTFLSVVIVPTDVPYSRQESTPAVPHVICNTEYCEEDSSVSVLCSGVDSNIEITCYYDGDREPSHPCKSIPTTFTTTV